MSVATQTLSPPSRTLMFLEGRAISELGAFLGALPLLSLAPRRWSSGAGIARACPRRTLNASAAQLSEEPRLRSSAAGVRAAISDCATACRKRWSIWCRN
jgi:hypothetical protein